jgi:4-carboxymuconolactone decarboxylase
VTEPDATFRPSAPRLPALGLDELDATQQRLVGGISDQFTTVPNLVLTLVRHPALYEAWLPLASKLLLDSAFDRRERELLIMRTAVSIGSHYEWGQHVALTPDLFDADDLARIVAGPDAAGWSVREAALLRAVDELHASAGISEATWTALAAELDEQQLVELPMLVGQYRMMAGIVNALGVQPEEGSGSLP